MSERIVHPSETRTEMTWLVLPQHTNNVGGVFGGQVMAWIDVCAAVSAQRFTRKVVVTAAMDNLSFKVAAKDGEVMVLQGQVNFAGRTSMEVGVRVESENPLTGERVHTSTAYLTFVALGDDGRPTQVPTLEPVTDTEKRRYQDACVRRERRIQARAEDHERRQK
ncbi:MAG: acyl-CoA hydrolase [Myxococcota bacterium]